MNCCYEFFNWWDNKLRIFLFVVVVIFFTQLFIKNSLTDPLMAWYEIKRWYQFKLDRRKIIKCKWSRWDQLVSKDGNLIPIIITIYPWIIVYHWACIVVVDYYTYFIDVQAFLCYTPVSLVGLNIVRFTSMNVWNCGLYCVQN